MKKTTLLIYTSIFIGTVIAFTDAYAFTVTTNPALSEAQCTEFRDGNRVYESKYIYVHADGNYTNESGTYPAIYPKDVFYNYGNEFVIRANASLINVANTLPEKVSVPNDVTHWSMPTNYVPAVDGAYTVMGAKSGHALSINRSILTPTDATYPAFQIAYSLTRARVNVNSPRILGPVTWQYMSFPDGNITKPWGETTKTLNVDADITRVECFNYYVRWCGDGLMTNGEECDGTAGTTPGTNTCNASCQLVTPPPVTPVCNPAKSGTQPAPVLQTDTLCSAGTPTGFASTVVGTTTNYTWSCIGNKTENCSANYNSDTPTPLVSIKKYAKNLTTGDTQAEPIAVTRGETFNYYYVVENSGSVAAKDVVVKDTFPEHLTFAGDVVIKDKDGAVVTSDWTCTKGVYTDTTRPTLICTKNDMPANSGKYTFTVPVTLAETAPLDISMQNVAYICAKGMPNPPKGPNGEEICNNTNPPPPPPPNQCDKTNPDSQKDPACIVVADFDLAIKKYVKGEDIFASVEKTEDFNYNIIVENVGPSKTSGTTTVVDSLPAGVTLNGTPSGNGWSCTTSANSFVCTTQAVVDANSLFNTITVPAHVEKIDFKSSGYLNYAYVHNPGEKDTKQCNADGSMPNAANGGINGENPKAVCNEDTKNFDSATINPPNPNGFDLRLKKLVNGDDESSNAAGGIVYTFQVQNLGELESSGTTTVIDDQFPVGITIDTIDPVQGEWTCVKDSATKFTCKTEKRYKKGEFARDIKVVAVASASISPGTYQNYACLFNEYDPNKDEKLEPETGKWKVNNCDPAVVVVTPPNSFDLKLKKYVGDITTNTLTNDGDHQTSNDGSDVDRDILTIAQGGTVQYRFEVQNLGPAKATGMTTVEDTLPDGFSISDFGATNTTTWTCKKDTENSRKFICTHSGEFAQGVTLDPIYVKATTELAIKAGEYSNIATVRNPGDSNPTNNSDPANIKIIVGYACRDITGMPATAVSPGTKTEYTCTALGYTGDPKNLEYQFKCNGVPSADWSSSNTGSCTAPSASSTTMPVSCGVREKGSPTTFSGSFEKSCLGSVTTTGGGGGGGGGASHIGKSCANGVPSCATFNSSTACEAAVGAANCLPADAVGMLACDVWKKTPQACQSGGGGGGHGPGYCGDGVLQAGEQCDLPGSSWCGARGDKDANGNSIECKIKTFITNPGANPITDLWVTIPTLSRARIGYTWLDEDVGKIAFDKNSVITGVNGKVFSLADTVGFGLKTRYNVPVMIEAEKKICLEADGSELNGNSPSPTTLCTTFGDAVMKGSRQSEGYGIYFYPETNGRIWIRPDLAQFVVLGNGDFQYQPGTPAATFSRATLSGNNSYITLFRGAQQYSTLAGNPGPTLNSGFQGAQVGNGGGIKLNSCTLGGNCSTDANRVTMATMPVRVSAAVVGSTVSVTSVVPSGLATIMNPASVIDGFFGPNFGKTNLANTVNSSNTALSTPIVVINGNPTPRSVTSLTDLESYALNGNKNIFAIKGDLTVNCPINSNAFMMDGVRTVIVEGNIIFKCNTAYASNDVISSWAWISNGGKIQVYNGNGTPSDKGVTNLAGVYVATTGEITYTGATTTQAILKVDGSLYGKAENLFKSRLYARGTSAYEILTTGTVITYSNRALVSPPPLLSNYLNNYNVSRVVQ